MDIITLIEIYIAEKISYKGDIKLIESYNELLLRLGNKLSKEKRSVIRERVESINEESLVKLQAVHSYYNVILQLIDAFNQDDLNRLKEKIEEKSNLLKEVIMINEFDLETIAYNNHIEEFVKNYSNSLIKPNIIPDEYKEKELLLFNLRIRQDVYENILELINNHNLAPMKP